MPKEQSHGGAQTIKQAKAAFKARGPTAVVSTAERRKLERGAVLLERASRLKEQEQRRRIQAKKKDEKGSKEAHVLLGTQVRLDRFGHKSSQFHLGAFVKITRPQPVAQQSREEPWETDDVDDDTLLDLAAESSVQHTSAPDDATRSQCHESRSSLHEDFSHWVDFLESSTQLARELSWEKPSQPMECTPADCTPAEGPLSGKRIPSFNSTDFDLDISMDDLEELDLTQPLVQPAMLPPVRSSISISNPTTTSISTTCAADREAMPPKPTYVPTAISNDRVLMPPPGLPAQANKMLPPPLPTQPKQQTSTNRVSKPNPSPAQTTNDYMPSDISFADLESLATEDFQLTQYDGG
ncbi:hypothetical protein MBLNU459_g0027t1 [Dothideomycetes sp. NU459]